MGNIIAVTNQKGGVGKTTSSVNLAACLGAAGRKTLLVDMDPQANASSACGLDVNNLEITVYDGLHDPDTRAVYAAEEELKNLSVLPSSIDLTGAELELIDHPNRETALKKLLDPLRDSFDYIVIDAPPSLGLLTVNVLTASDYVIVPVQAEYFALEGLSRIIKTIELIQNNLNPDLSLLGILVTLYDGRTNLARQVVEELGQAFPDHLFQTVINRSIRLSEAPSHGKPIIYYDPKSVGAENYQHFCEEVIHACEKTGFGSGAGQPAPESGVAISGEHSHTAE